MPAKLDLKALRHQTGLTNPQIAQFMGITLRTLYSYRDGEREISVKSQVRVQQLLHLTGPCPTCGQMLPTA